MTNLKKEEGKFFWDWFEANHLMFEFLDNMEEPQRTSCLANLQNALSAYSKRLYPLILPTDSNTFELRITTHCNRQAFHEAKSLLTLAPNPPQNWSFQTFIPPITQPQKLSIFFQNQILKPEDIWFVFLKNTEVSGQKGIRIFWEKATQFSDIEIGQLKDELKYLMVQLLGEEVYVENIHFVDVKSPYEDMEYRGFSKLINLSMALEKFKALELGDGME